MMFVAPTTAAADLTLNGEIFMHTPPPARRLFAAFALVLASLAPALAAQNAQADPERGDKLRRYLVEYLASGKY